jgi:hypothetical protein
MITETDEITSTLDAAARIWPELRDNRAALLRRVILRGSDSVLAERAQQLADRRTAIRETAGMFTGMWPADAAQQMRDEWPE